MLRYKLRALRAYAQDNREHTIFFFFFPWPSHLMSAHVCSCLLMSTHVRPCPLISSLLPRDCATHLMPAV
jgi:hypothetical protein